MFENEKFEDHKDMIHAIFQVWMDSPPIYYDEKREEWMFSGSNFTSQEAAKEAKLREMVQDVGNKSWI